MNNIKEIEAHLVEEGNEDVAEVIESFESRWRYAVFPAMIAFIILAVFGFYLIYGMLQRMEALSNDVNRMTDIIQETLPQMQQTVSAMSTDMHDMNEVIGTNFPLMERNIGSMVYSTQHIAATTNSMGNSMWQMNRNVSKPLSFMNKMIPWSNDKVAPPPDAYLFQQQAAAYQSQLNSQAAPQVNPAPVPAAPTPDPINYQQPYYYPNPYQGQQAVTPIGYSQ